MAIELEFEEFDASCPWCRKAELLVQDDGSERFYIMCLNCYSCGPMADSREDAMLVWCERQELEEDTHFKRASRTILMG